MPEIINSLDPEDDVAEQHYFVALAMLLDMRGGRFSFTEAEYEFFRARYNNQVQIIVSQRGKEVRLDLMTEGRHDN